MAEMFARLRFVANHLNRLVPTDDLWRQCVTSLLFLCDQPVSRARLLSSCGRGRAFLFYGQPPKAKAQGATLLNWFKARSEWFIVFLGVLFTVICFGAGIYRDARQAILGLLLANEEALSRASSRPRQVWDREGWKLVENQDKRCPQCNGALVERSGQRVCPRCGWTACS